MDVINDSIKAAYIVNEDYDNASKVKSKLRRGYFTTNENLGYLKQIDIKDKKVLTVCGSGDQAFLSIINGAQEVDTFDSNPLQYYIMELKKAAIRGLDKEEYLLFFPIWGGNINEMYNIKYYDRFKQYLNDDSREFWDYVYSHSNHHLYLLQLFSYSIDQESDYTKYYNVLKEALSKVIINFKLGNICQVGKSFNNTYKLIMLSNIFDHIYVDKEYNKCYEEEYLDMVKQNFYPLLDEEGMCIYYTQLPCIPIKRFRDNPSFDENWPGVKVLKK